MSNINSSSTDQVTELYVKKVMAGDIDDVRQRLIASMESLGYDIIDDEQNIIGRRGAKGWGSWFGSADVLDYGATLTIRLKSVSESSTRATFDYLVKHPMLNTGEKKIIVQEAKTIAAISKRQSVEKMCSVCETESTDDSRFCRNCGAPLTSEGAEREVLRLMAETRAGKTAVVASSVLTAVLTLVMTLLFILNNAGLMKPKMFVLFTIFSLIALASAAACSFFGWNRLKRALDTPESKSSGPPNFVPAPLETADVRELPPMKSRPASVTEGTTNLLEPEFVEVRKRSSTASGRETNELD